MNASKILGFILTGAFVMFGLILMIDATVHYLKTCKGPNVIQKLLIKLTGYTSSQRRILKEGGRPIQFYYFKCKTHGYVEDHPFGYRKRLECPKCGKGSVKIG